MPLASSLPLLLGDHEDLIRNEDLFFQIGSESRGSPTGDGATDIVRSHQPVGTILGSDKESAMPDKKTLERAQEDKKEGKSPSTQAGEFVREEMDHIRHGKHGARSTKQAIAIGLSKARRAGVALKPPKRGKRSTRRKAAQDKARGHHPRRGTSSKRSHATSAALRREGHRAASRPALARQARGSARRRSASSRRASARKAARTRARTRRSRRRG